MPTPLLIKENIPQPLINQTNNSCLNDASFTQMEYNNPGIDRLASTNYLIDYMKLQKNIDLGTNTINNNCHTININSLKRLPSTISTQNITSANIKLSDDNIRLMSGCDFSTNINPITGTPCFEAMQNLEDDTNYKMTFNEKGYLIAFTILTVGLLYKANYKLR
jgi:hypothetical protein